MTLSTTREAIFFVDNVRRLAAGLREPADYFAGTGAQPWCWPMNLIAFARKSRHDLQRRTFESRLHTRYVLVVNLGTAGTLNLDSTPYRLHPGECHLIFPHELHTYHDVEQEQILWLFITFELPDETPLRALRQANVQVDAATERLLGHFLDAYRARGHAAHRLQGILSEILLRLVECGDGATKKRRPGGQRPDGKLLETIHRHHARALPEALTVRRLATLLDRSESGLRTRFRGAFGISLGEYLHNLRLQEAVAMMRHSQASLTEIAFSCGFGSSSAFSRAFRNWAGTSPRKFRHSVAPDQPGKAPARKRKPRARKATKPGQQAPHPADDQSEAGGEGKKAA